MVTASASSSAGGQQGALSVCSQGNKQLSNCQLLQSLGNVPDSYTRIFIFSKVTNVWEGVSGLQLLTLLLPLEPSVHLPHLSQRQSPRTLALLSSTTFGDISHLDFFFNAVGVNLIKISLTL